MSKETRSVLAKEKQYSLLVSQAEDEIRQFGIPLAIAIGFFTFFIYFITCPPYLAGGDSTELTLVAKTLGIAHPPGYPLYTLLGKLFSFLPLGTVAKRMNLFSSFANSVAATFLFLATTKWSKSLAGGMIASLLFAFSPLVWTYAVTAEVFALNNLFVTGLIYLSVLIMEKPKLRNQLSLVALFWLGLGLTHHQTLIFYGLPFVIWLFWFGNPHLRKKHLWMRAGIAFALGLLPYIYLIWAGSRFPLMDWGAPSTIDGFLTHVLRREYGTLSLGGDPSIGVTSLPEQPLFDKWSFYFSSAFQQLLYIGVPLTALGTFFSLRMKNRLQSISWLWVICFLFYITVFFSLSDLSLNSPLSLRVQARFWLQPHILLFAWAGITIGIIDLWLRSIEPDLLAKEALQKQKQEQVQVQVQRHGQSKRLILYGAVFIFCGIQVGLNFNTFFNGTKNRAFHDFGKAILTPLPQGALIFTQGDGTYGILRYLQWFEGIRPDVRIIERSILGYSWSRPWIQKNYPEITLPPTGNYTQNGYTMNDFLVANQPKFPIFRLGEFKKWDTTYLDHFKVIPYGLVMEIVPQSQTIDFESWKKICVSALSSIKIDDLSSYPAGSWESVLEAEYWEQYQNFATQMMRFGVEPEIKPDLLKEGISLLEWIDRKERTPQPLLYKNLGVGYQFLSKTDPSAKAKMIQAWTRYLELQTNLDDPEIPYIRSTLESAKQIAPGK